MVLRNNNGVVNLSSGDPTRPQPLTLINLTAGVAIPHKVEQSEEAMAQVTVAHPKQQHLKDGVVNHHNQSLVLDMDKSQNTEV